MAAKYESMYVSNFDRSLWTFEILKKNQNDRHEETDLQIANTSIRQNGRKSNETRAPKAEPVKTPAPSQVRQQSRPTDGAVAGERSTSPHKESEVPSSDAGAIGEDRTAYSRVPALHDILRERPAGVGGEARRSYNRTSAGTRNWLSRSGDATAGREMTKTVIENKRKAALLVAAIDFGTTYSGYAYSFMQSPDDILTNYWDSVSNVSVKTPTVVLIDPNKKFHSFGEEARKQYEELMKKDVHKKWYLFERFKMKLFVKEIPLEKDMEIEDILGKPMKAIEVFTAAIRYIREHLLGVLNDPNRKDHIAIKEDTDIRWVLTVPAIWNDLSKKFMREAANKAGIPDEMLLLALEPEAASLFCKKELGISKVPVGCKYLVLDLGGGTADITCHEVNEDGTLKELYPPTGGDFGGTTVDNAFIKVLIKIFGAPVINKFKKEFMNEYWELMADFELKKRKFDGSGRVILKFPVRMIELYEADAEESVEETLLNSNMPNALEFKHGKIFITEALMKEIFNSAVTKIKEKTEELLKEVPHEINSILLVGGFSESLYLQQVMRENFDNLIILPKEPAGAVLNGAVIYGHESKAISSRKCRYTYGIARMIKFDDKKHPKSKKRVLNSLTLCDDAFYKHIEIGTEVSVNTPEKAKAHKYFPSSPDYGQTVLEVYKSKRRTPEFVDEDGCEFVGLVKVEIDPKGDIWSPIMVKLIFGGTELKVEVEDQKNRTVTTGSVDFFG